MDDTELGRPQEHIASLRQHLSTIQNITNSVRREPRDTERLKEAERLSEKALLRLEIWAASQTHE